MRQTQTTFLAVLWVFILAFPIAAQTQSGASAPALRTGAQVLTLTKKEELKNIPADAKIIRLNMTLKDILEDLQRPKKENAQPLLDWVKNGGVVWLHTDAAQLFGFTTVPVQSFVDLIGKAKPVAPWHAHPLVQGVRKIFYAMQEHSAFVTGHPRGGVMLMRVADHPAPRPQPLFVCAEVAFGSGVALVVPPEVSQQRAEGLQFLDNLQRFSVGEPATYRISGAELDKVLAQWQLFLKERSPSEAKKPFSAVAAYAHLWLARLLHTKLDKTKEAFAELEKAANSNNQIAEVYAALSEVYAAMGDKEKSTLARQRAEQLAKSERPASPDARAAVGLLLTEGELTELTQLMDAGGSTDRRNELGALLTTMAGRVFYQANDLDNAEKLFNSAVQQARTSAERISRHALFWLAALRTAQGLQVQLASPERAARLREAVSLYEAFADPRNKSQDEPKDNAFPSTQQLTAWVRGLNADAVRLNLEPPSIVVQNGLIVRFTPGDAGWRRLVPVVQTAMTNAASLGLRVEEPELVVFPNLNFFDQYRQLVKRSLPEFGPGVPIDVEGERILAVAQQNQLPRNLLGHQFGHVAVNAWTEGVQPEVPAWLTEGVARNLEGFSDPRSILRQARQQGLLLNWNDLAIFSPQLPDLFYAQSQEMVAFLARVGKQKGGVARVLQLVGMGISAEEALREVTGLTPEQFMVAWARAEFG